MGRTRACSSVSANTRGLGVLSREARQDLFVDLILAEDRLIPPEAKAPQPDHNVRDGAPNLGLPHIVVRAGGECPGASKMGGFPCQSVSVSNNATLATTCTPRGCPSIICTFGVNRCHHQNSATLAAHVSSANQCHGNDRVYTLAAARSQSSARRRHASARCDAAIPLSPSNQRLRF
jgi:hypothetical protein